MSLLKTKFFDYLLLNSDGLTDFILNQAIQEELMTDHTLEQHGQNLINLALANDSNDNVSVILAEIEGDKV